MKISQSFKVDNFVLTPPQFIILFARMQLSFHIHYPKKDVVVSSIFLQYLVRRAE
jgi:hypothetical protein